MSKGPGRLQRIIIALTQIEGGAWPLESLCDHVYDAPDPDWRQWRTQKSAIGRAVERMKLPGTWVFRRVWEDDILGGGRCWLYNPCNLESVTKVVGAGRAASWVEDAVRWRDASEIERIDMQIAHLEGANAMFAEVAKAVAKLRIRSGRRPIPEAVRLQREQQQADARCELGEKLASLRRQRAELLSV